MAHATERYGDWPLQRLMTDVVGSGPKSADDMTSEQAQKAFERILAGEPDPTTLGAFWLGEPLEEEQPRRTRRVPRRDGARVICREPGASPSATVDCGANYDGKAPERAPRRLRPASSPPPRARPSSFTPATTCRGGMGVAYKHVLDELGVQTDLAPRVSPRRWWTRPVSASTTSRGSTPASTPSSERREKMGVRTFVNTVETLANPANADVHLGSFYHLAFATKVSRTPSARPRSTATSPASSCSRGWRATTMSSSARRSSRSGARATTTSPTSPSRPRRTGWTSTRRSLAVDDVAADSAQDHASTSSGANATTRSLMPSRSTPRCDSTLARTSTRIEAGFLTSREVIADGSAEAVLDELRGF